MKQVTVLSGIALIMTVGVYGFVAGIVKLDDGGLYLSRQTGDGFFRKFQVALGRGILRAAPWMMKSLSVIGTAAMFMVGGGILTHGTPGAHDIIHHAAVAVGPVAGALLPTLIDATTGVIAGALVLGVVMAASKVMGAIRS
jgi:predicted DNA repair protein MutK